jgi:O-antigen/teichoic acid export membrane protein
MGMLVGTATGAGAAAVWFLAPQLAVLESSDRSVLAGPFAILVVATIVSAPLAVFGAVLTGIQDVTWVGSTAVAKSVATAAITVGLLADGRGLYALSMGTSLPLVVIGIANVLRLARVDPSLVRNWPTPSIPELRRLVLEGVGGWLGAFGWRLAAMSSSLVLAVTGRAEWIAIYACTSKTTQLALPASWVVPDSALVGLSHVHGEGRHDRRREIVDALLKLYLVLSGAAALSVLALNPAFVRWWVGDAFYGGVLLNALLAIGLVVTSIAHGCAAISSVLGRRRTIGVAGLLQGAIHLALSAFLAVSFGLNGLGAAVIVSAAVTMLPIGLRTLGLAADISPRDILGDVMAWSVRAAPILAIGAAIGASNVTLWVALAALAPLEIAYLWLTRTLYAGLPVPPALRRWMVFA